MIAVFAVSLWVLNFLMQRFDNNWTELLINGFISVGISLIVCVGGFVLNWETGKRILFMFKNKIKKH